MTFQPGDDVIVEFVGRDHPGEVVFQQRDWVQVRIHIDPVCDYGALSDRLDPEPTVIVRSKHVRHAE